MRRLFKDRRFIYPLVLTLFAGGVAVTAYLYILDQQQQRAQARDRLLQAAGMVRVGIEQQVNTSLNLTMGLVIYVTTNPQLDQRQFAAIAARILSRAPYIRNIGLAKDSVLSHIYPLEGNQAALGRRLTDLPQQRAAVVRAIESKRSVVAGPVELVQGGSGFISRIPIFLDSERTRYWGLASVVMNVDAFFRAAGVAEFGAGLDIALRGKDSLGEAGDVFYGDAGLFGRRDVVELPIALPQGSWLLAARPHDGWSADARRSALLLGGGLAVSLLLSLFLYFLLDLLVALSRANQRAAQASAQKTRFFSHMTHELRTPLTAIHGAVSLLASGKLPLPSKQSGELLQNALRNCQRLQWIINDMLDLKKLESGTVALSREPLALSALLAEAADGVQHFAQHYGIDLCIDNRVGTAVCVRGDRVRLQQVLVNLLSNAIKYSPDRGRVTVNAFLVDDTVRVEVIDQGEGVSEDKLDVVFEEFGQDKPSPRSGIPSTGLGLSISKQIIDRHGGRIGCLNLATGGCCFFIELPCAEVDGM